MVRTFEWRNVQPADTARQIELPTHRDRLHGHVAWHRLRPPTMLAVHHAHATPTATRGYARRQPEDTVLYGVVQDHVATLLDTARDHSEDGFGYPRFVEREFEMVFGAAGTHDLSGVQTCPVCTGRQ